MGMFSKFAKVAHVHFSSWKQSIVGVSASWPHAVDTPTSHWHGVSSEECLGDGQPLLLKQTQKSWQCSRWWMVLPDLSLQVLPKIFYWIEIQAAGWPVHPDHPWPRHSSDDTPCQWDVCVLIAWGQEADTPTIDCFQELKWTCVTFPNFENVPIVTKVLINLEPEIKMSWNFVCMELNVKPNFG